MFDARMQAIFDYEVAKHKNNDRIPGTIGWKVYEQAWREQEEKDERKTEGEIVYEH